MCSRGKSSVSVVIDRRIPSGVLGSSLAQSKLEELSQKLENYKKATLSKLLRSPTNQKK